MVIYIDFAALRLWFHNSIQQVEGRDNILIVRFDKQTRILMKRRKLISRHGIIIQSLYRYFAWDQRELFGLRETTFPGSCLWKSIFNNL